jgi:hypothetical protein
MISLEAIKTCVQGALGAMTFGAYHMYVTKSMMEINNEMIATKNQIMEKEIEELKKRLNSRWF